MTRTLGVVPPDHPMFSGGPHFVFRSEPQADDDPPEVDVTLEEDVEKGEGE